MDIAQMSDSLISMTHQTIRSDIYLYHMCRITQRVFIGLTLKYYIDLYAQLSNTHSWSGLWSIQCKLYNIEFVLMNMKTLISHTGPHKFQVTVIIFIQNCMCPLPSICKQNIAIIFEKRFLGQMIEWPFTRIWNISCAYFTERKLMVPISQPYS